MGNELSTIFKNPIVQTGLIIGAGALTGGLAAGVAMGGMSAGAGALIGAGVGAGVGAVTSPKPRAPKMPGITQVSEPTRLVQGDASKEAIMAQFAKKRRATMLSQTLAAPNLSKQTLGVGS